MPLPSAQAFEILTPLHSLLSRLLLEQSDKDALTTKELAPEVAVLKLTIQRARTMVQGLPDAQRTVEDQALEIEALRNKIQKQKKALASIAEAAGANPR